MRTLIVEDDFASRKFTQKMFKAYGECDAASTGNRGIAAFKSSHDHKNPYDLIMLDIMLPDKDGQTILQEIRLWEEQHGIYGYDGVKIIMMTALGDDRNIMRAFKSQCEGYLVKPIDREKVTEILRKIELID